MALPVQILFTKSEHLKPIVSWTACVSRYHYWSSVSSLWKNIAPSQRRKLLPLHGKKILFHRTKPNRLTWSGHYLPIFPSSKRAEVAHLRSGSHHCYHNASEMPELSLKLQTFGQFCSYLFLFLKILATLILEGDLQFYRQLPNA